MAALSGFGSEADLRRGGHIKDDKLRLEKDVSVDGKSNTGV